MKHQDIAWLLREKYHGEKSDAFFADCERLTTGTPLAYLIGSVPFLDTTIFLDSHPLIPRPETEYWTEAAIKHIQHHSLSNTLDTIHILDLCAGSGAIGVAVAAAIPHTFITFAEIDPAHLPTIARNCMNNGLTADRYTLTPSDLYEQVTGPFDYILSNPPYIDKAADTVADDVTAHEPHLALFGGEKGLAVIERIIAGAQAVLAPRGQLWLEHEPFQQGAIARIASQYQFHATAHPDQYGTVRYSILTEAVAK